MDFRWGLHGPSIGYTEFGPYINNYNGNQHCISYTVNNWNDLHCDAELVPACEKPISMYTLNDLHSDEPLHS